MTCPVPRRLMSTKRKLSDDTQSFSQLAKSSFMTDSCRTVNFNLAFVSVLVLRSAPEIGLRKVGARHLLANKAPELAYLHLDLCALLADDLEDKAGIIGQPTGATGHTARKVDIGLRARIDAVRFVLGRAQDHVAKDVERIHHAGLPH